MNEIGKIYHLHSGMETPYILRNLGKSDIEQILDLQDRALGYDFNLQWFYPFSAEELVEIFDSDGSIANWSLHRWEAYCFSDRLFFGELNTRKSQAI